MHRLPPFRDCPRMPLGVAESLEQRLINIPSSAQLVLDDRTVSGEPILLVGAGGHARACIDVIEQERRFVVGGLIGHRRHEVGTNGPRLPGARHRRRDPASFVARYRNALVAVGQIKTPEPRMRLFELLERHHVRLPGHRLPAGYVSRHATVGAGSIVMHGAVVNAGATVGRNCIINSQALVEHDAAIGDHCHISTSSAVNSGVRVGAGTFIGSGRSVRQGLLDWRTVCGRHGTAGADRLRERHACTCAPTGAILKTLIIAEAGVNHNGDLGLARGLVDAAAAAGADMVKFQTFSADRLHHAQRTKSGLPGTQRPDAEESQHAMLRRLELTPRHARAC